MGNHLCFTTTLDTERGSMPLAARRRRPRPSRGPCANVRVGVKVVASPGVANPPLAPVLPHLDGKIGVRFYGHVPRGSGFGLVYMYMRLNEPEIALL